MDYNNYSDGEPKKLPPEVIDLTSELHDRVKEANDLGIRLMFLGDRGYGVLRREGGGEILILKDFKDMSIGDFIVQLVDNLKLEFNVARNTAKRLHKAICDILFPERETVLEKIFKAMRDLEAEERLEVLRSEYNRDDYAGEMLRGYFEDTLVSVVTKARGKAREEIEEDLRDKGKSVIDYAKTHEIAEAIVRILEDAGFKFINYRNELYINDNGLFRDGGFIAKKAQEVFGVYKKSLAQELENIMLAKGRYYDEETLKKVLNPEGKLLVKNGVLNLDTLGLEDLKDHELFSFRLDWEVDRAMLKEIPKMGYDDFKKMAPRFFELFEHVFDNEGSRDQAIEMLGATLITSPVRKLFLLIGERGTGKTTFLTVLDKVFDPAFANVEFSKITNPEWRWNYALLRALINTSAERSEVIARSPDRIKQLVGEYYLDYEAKHRNPIRGRNITTHIFALNQPPLFPHYGDFIESLYIIFTTEKRIEKPRKMGNVVNEIVGSEKNAIAHFIIWCYYQLTRDGYMNFKHDMSEEEKRDYLIREGNPIALFLKKECVVEPRRKEKGLKLYERFCEFCKREGHKPPSLVKFYAILRSMG
ncbi:MAG: DUF5906 domain-containing protein, partial [Candidatus Nezhaarchaeales archaeon]